MSSSEVRIIDHGVGNGYTVTTGESVVIGHGETPDESTDLAWQFLSWHRRNPRRSDSRVVADLLDQGLIPSPTPDDN